MKTKHLSERGQALIIVALAAIGLFAVVGLAIDGAAKLSDQRHAQNAADTAAVTAALGLVNSDPDWKTKALDRAYENGYTGDLVHSKVEVHLCSEDEADCGAYADNPKYVQVIIDSNVNATFARVIGISQLHNRVQAVTYFNQRGPLYDGSLIVSLKPDPCTGNGANGNIALGTSGGHGSEAEIHLSGGGAFINSGGSGCGMEVMGCPTITVDGGILASVGDGNINLDVGSQTCSDKLTLPGELYNQEPYPFPPEMPDVPDACGQAPNPPTNDKKEKKSILYPGYYSEFPPTKGAYKDVFTDDMELYPGVYCFGADFSLTNKQYVHGSNVLIYMKPGHVFSIQGGTVSLSGRETGDYQGYVMIVDSNFSGQSPNCIVNGAAETAFTGTILAPYCDVEIDGGGKTTSYSAQIIGYTVKVTGSQTVNLLYKEEDSARNEPKVGLMQ